MKIRYVMLILVLMLLVGAASAWLPNSQYRKSNDIAGSPTGAQTNYQMMFIVHRTTGTDAGAHVYVGNKCNADYSDIRFTTAAADNVPLDYWIQVSNSSIAQIWVEVPSIPTTGTTIYMYYGNVTANSKSNGDATFRLFDHFDGTALNTTKWSATSGVSVGNSLVTVTGANAYRNAISTAIFEPNTRVLIRGTMAQSDSTALGFFSSDGLGAYFRYLWPASNAYNTLSIKSSTLLISDNLGNGYTGSHTWQVARVSGTEDRFAVDGITVGTTHTTNIYTGNRPVGLQAWTSGSSTTADWVALTKYVSPEPTSNTWGPEVSLPLVAFHSDVTSGIVPLSVHFYDDSSPNIDSRNWYFNATSLLCPFGSDSTDQNPVWTYTTPGTYNVSLRVNNSVGSNETIKYSYINVLPQPGYEIPSLPYDITPEMVAEHGKYFKITKDWTGGVGNTYAVMISAPEVILDVQNHTLAGTLDGDPGTFQTAIIAGNTHNVTVGNLRATGWNGGIFYNNVNGGNLGKNWIENSANSSIFILDSRNLIVTANTITNSEFGINIANSENIQVVPNPLHEGNTITDCSNIGIGASDSTSVIINGSTVSDNQIGIHYQNTSGGIGYNIVNNNKQGISGFSGKNLNVFENIVNNNNGNGEIPGIGIFLSDMDTLRIFDNYAAGNTQSGIQVSDSTHGTVMRNTLSGNEQDGILIQRSNDIGVFDNQAEYHVTFPGINVGDSDSVFVYHNNVGHNQYGIAYQNTNNGAIIGNTANNNVNGGIGGNFCNNITVRNNIADDNAGEAFTSGISFISSENINLNDNIVSRNGHNGINLAETTQSGIVNNTASGNSQFGITLYQSDGISIIGNRANLTTNGPGIGVSNSTSIIVSGNDINDNILGIWFVNVTGSSNGVYDNNVQDNTEIGIGMVDGTGPVFIHTNRIEGSNEGLHLEPGVSGILVADNYFSTFNNVAAPQDITGIEWNVTQQPMKNIIGGLYVGGNYWGKPDGTGYSQIQGANIDGFISEPFHVLGDSESTNIDYLPLAYQGIHIWPGWNFVSVPKTLEAGHNTARVVFADVNMDQNPVWTYNAGSGGWRTLEENEVLQSLDAYWVYSTQMGPFVPYIYSTETGPNHVPRVKSLVQGWNAIGLGSVYLTNVEQELPTIREKWDVILDFDNYLQDYNYPKVNGQTNGWGMEPKKGYWIYMNSPGDIVAMTG